MSHKFNRYDVTLPRAGADPSNIATPENRAWDERILNLLLAGKHAEVLELSGDFKTNASPEGRWAHYLNMVAALGGDERRMSLTASVMHRVILSVGCWAPRCFGRRVQQSGR